ncbi:MAG TPA: peptide chain release factor N(5)-glutamine methyltransferase [Caulobacterales bacterium]|nr:peptide chain release factor N(5)-glutamine methyltransferase [Caulobacterales bacterium]
MSTLVSVWGSVRDRLRAAGVETPVFDARLLLEAGAGVSRTDIVTDPQRVLSEDQLAGIEPLVRRREAREPVSHILGRKAFWTLELAITPDVLTPRPETELLVEMGLEQLDFAAPARVLDLGTGSGAVLCALLNARPLASGVGVDVSPAALAVAQANAAALGLEGRTDWIEGDWSAAQGAFDYVASNPPYIRTDAIDLLPPEVGRYEPRLALDGGPDGLDSYRFIMPLLPGLLTPEGVFAVEIGAGQAEAVWALADEAGLQPAGVRRDLAGHSRVVWGRGRPAALGGAKWEAT